MKIPAFAAAMGLALAATAPAHAGQVAVNYTDLNLNSEQGRAVLKNRVEAAAREVCGMNEAQMTGSKLPSRSMRECYRNATSQISDKIAAAVERRNKDG